MRKGRTGVLTSFTISFPSNIHSHSAVWHGQLLSSPPSLHLDGLRSLLSHLRAPSSLQHPFGKRLTAVWHAVPNEAAPQVYWEPHSSFRVLSTHCLCSQTATLPAQGQHDTGQSSPKSSLTFAHTSIWLIPFIQDLWGYLKSWVCSATHIILNVPTLSFVCQSTARSFNLALLPQHFSQLPLATGNSITLSHLQIFIQYIYLLPPFQFIKQYIKPHGI